jgi:iron-sulfur cluster assembly protein
LNGFLNNLSNENRLNMAIMLTKSAAERVRSFLDKDGGIGLRLGVRKTGCSGWAYTVQLAEDIQQDDIIFENDGVKVVVSQESLGFLDGSEIDFVSEGLGMTFKFNNPNVTDECGCGESFTIG